MRYPLPLADLTADEPRVRAREYREMAKAATSEQTGAALIRLAQQFEALALKKRPRSRAG